MENKDKTPELDPTVHAAIAAIISKDPLELSDSDKAFLRARQSYLGKNARRKFADALSEKQAVPVKEEVTAAPQEVVADNSAHPAEAKQESTPTQETEEDVE